MRIEDAQRVAEALRDDLEDLAPSSAPGFGHAADPWVDDWRRLPGRVGRYRLIREIGSGGMGVVYEAEQEEPRRSVALKLLRRGLPSGSSARLGARSAARSAERRFADEAQALARLRHPGVAAVYECGLHLDPVTGQRFPWLAMELIEGALALDRYAERHRLGLRDRVRLVAEVCDAVHHGHQKGVIHRDLKPDNILVGADARPRVIDFGVARLRVDTNDPASGHRTIAGELLGTLRYMSPEQRAADPDGIDTRTDIYALGAILYELLCGGPLGPEDLTPPPDPFAPGSDLPCPRRVCPQIPRDLEAVILKAMERDRERRYASAAELAADLRAHLRGDPVSARAPGPWTRFARWLGRHPIAATAAACAGLFCTTTAGTALFHRFVYAAPAGVRWDRGDEAYLISRGGALLHTWTGVDAEITRPAAAARVRTGDPRTPWVVCLRLRPGDGGATLAAYDPRRPGEPLWNLESELSALRPPHQAWIDRRDGEGWTLGRVWRVADVFPSRPGDEIVAIVRHVPWYPSAVVVVDPLRGQVLHTVWHTGPLDDVRWLPAQGVLAASGTCGRLPPGLTQGLNPHRFPPVAFAWRPELGRIDRSWITSPDVDAPSRTEWYQALLDPRIVDGRHEFHFVPADGWTVTLAADVDEHPGADLLWTFGFEGPGVEPDVAPVPDYLARLHELPPAERRAMPDPADPRLRWTPVSGFDPVGDRRKADEAGQSPPR